MSENKVKSWFISRGIKQRDIAEVLGITEQNVSLKINKTGGNDFTKAQIELLNETYEIPVELFF